MALNIVSIATPGKWLDVHAARWLRFVRRSNPTAKLGIMIPGEESVMEHGIVQEFDMVKLYKPDVFSRPWVNSVRMGACTEFGVEECLYIDCDCDVYGDMSEIQGFHKDKALLWCKSKCVNPSTREAIKKTGLTMPEYSSNNGLLYLRRDLSEEWAKAYKKVSEVVEKARAGGVATLSVMVQLYPELTAEIPYCFSTVWSDFEERYQVTEEGPQWMPRAIQWCNDEGQSKREAHEHEWRRSLY